MSVKPLLAQPNPRSLKELLKADESDERVTKHPAEGCEERATKPSRTARVVPVVARAVSVEKATRRTLRNDYVCELPVIVAWKRT